MRKPRTMSESNFYHVVFKGSGGRLLFENNDDRSVFLAFLRDALANTALYVHAFCLMDNHVHLVVEAPFDELSRVASPVEQRYAQLYNLRYQRTGPLFVRPFWSEPINSEEQLLCTVRYVHNNPAAAGICKPADWRWSSYLVYAENIDEFGIVTSEYVLDLLGSRDAFLRFSAPEQATMLPYPGSHLTRHHSQAELASIARDILGNETLNELKRMNVRERAPHLKLLASRGFGPRQIARVTDLSISQVQNALR